MSASAHTALEPVPAWMATAFARAGDGAIAFGRAEVRHRRSKVRGDCGHFIDGSLRRLTPYRYQVWKVIGEPGVRQLLECEECARRDVEAWRQR